MKTIILLLLSLSSASLSAAGPCNLDIVLEDISNSSVVKFAKEMSSLVRLPKEESKKFNSLSTERILALSPKEICNHPENGQKRKDLQKKRADNFCKNTTKGEFPFASYTKINSGQNDTSMAYKDHSSSTLKNIKLETELCRGSKKYPHKFTKVQCDSSRKYNVKADKYLALAPKEVCVGETNKEKNNYRYWVYKKRADSVCKAITGGRSSNWEINQGQNSLNESYVVKKSSGEKYLGQVKSKFCKGNMKYPYVFTTISCTGK